MKTNMKKKRKNIIKKIILLLMVMLVLGCAGIEPVERTMKANIFTSNHPSLKVVVFKGGPVKYEKTENNKWYHYSYGKDKLEISIYKHWKSKGFDYYYGLEAIASNNNMLVLGECEIDNHRWLKCAKYIKNSNWFVMGYFTRKDDYFIFVYKAEKIESHIAYLYENIQTGQKLNEPEKEWLNEQFKKVDKLFIIHY